MRTISIGVALVAALFAAAGPLSVAGAVSPEQHDDHRVLGVGGIYASTYVRAVHASPGAPAVDVWVDGMMAFGNVSFGEATRYARLPSGEHTLSVVPAGTTSPIVFAAGLDLAANSAFTVAVVGTGDDIRPMVLEDRTMPTWRTAHLRFVHASPDAPAVDLALEGGMPLFANVEFGDRTRHLRVPSGVYDLEVRVEGTDTVALPVPNVRLERGSAYTAFAIGTLEDGTLDALLVDDYGRGHSHMRSW